MLKKISIKNKEKYKKNQRKVPKNSRKYKNSRK